MSAHKVTYIYCDGPNCQRDNGLPLTSDADPSETAAWQRNHLFEPNGWKRVGGKDLCDLCAARVQIEKEKNANG